jgi:O-antigen/teichoic acid export membrane protein
MKLIKSFKNIFNSDAIGLTAASYLQTAVSVFTSFFIILKISTLQIGFFNSAMLFREIMLHLNIGEIESLRKSRGGKLADLELKNIYATVLGISLITITTLVIALAVIIVFFSEQEDFKFALMITCILFVLDYYQYYFMNLLKGESKFKQLKKYIFINAIFSLLVIIGVYSGGFTGLLYAKIVVSSLSLMALYVISQPVIGRFTINYVKEIIYTGWPLQLAALSTVIYLQLPRISLTILGDFNSLGLFTVASYFAIPIQQLTNNIAIILFPKLMNKQDKVSLSLYKFSIKGRFIFYLLLLGLLLILSEVITLFFSEYTSLINASRLLVSAAVLQTLYVNQLNLIIANGLGKKLAYVYAVSGLLVLLFIFLFIDFNFHLYDLFAFASFISSILLIIFIRFLVIQNKELLFSSSNAIINFNDITVDSFSFCLILYLCFYL